MMIYVTVLSFIAYTTKAQFPDHIDLEKLGEVEYQNDVYKILRPSLHKVRDHFKDVMMKTNIQPPNKKLLMDNNGFRHTWSTLDKPESVQEASNHIEETMEANSFEIIKELSLPKDSEDNEPLKNARKKIILEAIMEQWKLDKDKVLKTKPEFKAQEKKLHPVDTIILCPYFGLIRAKHYVEDEDESSILR
ncbi:hypothetical protein O0L34_g18809 [Tuta absoluta]|nr:hypothetical protein O0L34_g18809 [Tuta absoluta]